MPNTRLFLVVALFMLGFLIWQQWQIDYGPKVPAPIAATTDGDGREDPASSTGFDSDDDIPSRAPIGDLDSDDAAPQLDSPIEADPEEQIVRITTDLLDLELSTRGGSLVDAILLDYPVTPGSDERVQFFSRDRDRYFVADIGMVNTGDGAAPSHREIFVAEQTEYSLGSADELIVPLLWNKDGLEVLREYVFTRGSYRIDVRDTIINRSGDAWSGAPYRQFQRRPPPDPGGNIYTHPERFSFSGPAYYTAEEKYEKFDYDDLDDGPVGRDGEQTWIAMVQHYFFAAWIGDSEAVNDLDIRKRAGDIYRVRSVGQQVAVADGQQETISSTLWLGPKLQDEIDSLATGLELTVDYGIFTPFSKILYWLLEKIHSFTGNWGWAIVLLTVLVKAVFFKLTEAQYRSMAKMRKLQPRIQKLKERFGDDRQQFQVKMMEIYKKEKVNPFGGCLPVLIQIPVFISLYWVLVESVELRQAPFMLWIQDLSSPDPYFILPIINGAAMFMTTKLSPNPAADPIQQKVMLAMPLIFSVMFAFFQSGLVLYWAVNASLSLLQQWIITRRIDAQS